jgi:phage virion morphogenesis protein
VPIRLTIDTGGGQRLLAEVQGRLANLEPALTAIKEVALDSIRQNFEASGRPEPWAPLKYRQGKPLILSGRLRASITGEVQGSTVVLGTNLSYAAIHNYGGTTTWGKRTVTIPQRQYMLVQEADATTFAQILTAHLTRGL